MDTIVRVNRSVTAYPGWVKEVMHPELELVGPYEYNLKNDVFEWFHDDQKSGIIVGHTIYNHLKESGALPSCLGLTDLLAIQAKGITVFRKLFNGNPFGWKSVVQGRLGFLHVPCLYDSGSRINLSWYWLNNTH